jgi:glycolate oxidase FAD binding subunit
MISAELRSKLASAVGAEAIFEHPPRRLDGVDIHVTLRPSDGESLSRSLESLGALGLSAVVLGGGNRVDVGNLPASEDLVWLSTERLSGVEEFDPEEGVCLVRAGTPLQEVRERVLSGGWELPLDAPGAGATVGGVLAAAAVGPRALGFGRPRDLVLGLQVVLASGERTRCGGRVVKNVTGYDLNKLYTGSFGTLCVIESAWLRLRPRPEVTRVYEVVDPDLIGLAERGVAAARRFSVRAVVLAATPGRARVALELAGDASSVERDAAWLEDQVGARPGAPDAVERTAALASPATGGLRFRIDALPTRLPAAWEALCSSSERVVAFPGSGLVYAEHPVESDNEDELHAAFQQAARVAGQAGGGFLCESAPAWAKRGRDVFAAGEANRRLARRLKQRFDPGGVLSPGRFVGCV